MYALAEVPGLTAEESNDLTGTCYQRRLGVSSYCFLTSVTLLQARHVNAQPLRKTVLQETDGLPLSLSQLPPISA